MLSASPPPIQCSQQLLDQTKSLPAIRTAIVNAINDVALQSARDATEAGIITPVLIGERAQMAAAAQSIGWDISRFEQIEALDETAAANAGAQAAGRGDVASLMKGHLHTDVFMRAILNREAGLRLGQPFTHIFHLTLPGDDGALLLTDCALNPAPDLELKKAITRNAVTLARATGIARPKVAVLSATEVPNKHIPSSLEADELKHWAVSAMPDADLDGPLAFDLAVSAEATRIKGITSNVAGAADIIVVPEIVAGNALYKMLVHFAGACAGGIVLGAKVPIILTSRADPPAARLASAALAAIAAQSQA